MSNTTTSRQPRVEMRALGIAIGAIVETRYHSGSSIGEAYEVTSLYGPRYTHLSFDLAIWPYPVISLGLARGGQSGFAINDIRQYVLPDGSSRWFTDQNDEVIVRPASVVQTFQLDLFGSTEKPLPAPYAWQPGVDYAAASRHELLLWRCERCKRDFAYQPPHWAEPAWCEQCNYPATSRIIVMPNKAGLSVFTRRSMRSADSELLPHYVQHGLPDELCGLRAVGEVDLPGSSKSIHIDNIDNIDNSTEAKAQP